MQSDDLFCVVCGPQLFGVKSEVCSAEQPDLFLNEAEALAPTASMIPAQESEAKFKVAGHKREKHRRKPLDPALLRETIRYELPESDRRPYVENEA